VNEMLDMSRFVEAKSDQLNADDLIGAPRTITITRVTGNDGDQPVAIHYEGDNGKPFKPCKTIRRVLMGVWGRYANEYVGKSMTLYRDDSVTFGGLATGGIRISHMSGIDKETVVVVLKAKGKKAGVKILPLAGQNKEDGALKWSKGFITKVSRATDRVELEQLIEGQSVRLAELNAKRPELHAECDAAIGDARRRFEPNHGTLSDDNPAASEGRDTADMGEASNDDGLFEGGAK